MQSTSRPSATAVILLVIAGITVALVAWWLIEHFTNEATRRFRRAFGPGFELTYPLLLAGFVAAVATLVTMRSTIILVAATATVALGLILGGYGQGSPLVSLPSNDLQLTLLRGAHHSVMWVLLGVWTALLAHRWFAELRTP